MSNATDTTADTDTTTATVPGLSLVIEERQYRLDGKVVPVPSGSVHQVAMGQIAAGATGPVRVTATDESGVYQLLVDPDGSVTALPDAPAPPVKASSSVKSSASVKSGAPAKVAPNPTPADGGAQDLPPAAAPSPASGTDEQEEVVRPDAAPTVGQVVAARDAHAPDTDPDPRGSAPQETAFSGGAAVGAMAGVAPATRAERRQARESVTFLPGADETFAAQVPAPPAAGWQGVLERLGLRRRPAGPSPEQLIERAELRAIAQHWPGPRTIAVVNPKGGAGKTPTTILLAAMFARWGGAGCVAWDNNQTRGTMGWRTEQGPHTAHVRDLLAAADELMRPGARAADMAGYVHHQTEDKFDVLRSNPHSIAPQERLTGQDLDVLHQVAARYYRLIFIDSGNDESAPNWLRMIEHTDQLVVATTTRPDHAEAARLVLDELHEQSDAGAALADEAVVVVAHADQSEEPATSYLDRFGAMARAAGSIPYDPGMRAAHLRLDGLRPDTKAAWRHAAALVAAGLGTSERV